MVLSGVQGEIGGWWKGGGNDGKGEEEVNHAASLGATGMNFQPKESDHGRMEIGTDGTATESTAFGELYPGECPRFDIGLRKAI